jgi:predicted transcriptional regulator
MVGFLTPHKIKALSINDRRNKTVKEVMMPLQKIINIKADESLLDALRAQNENDEGEIPIMENGNCIGILNQTSILRFIFELHKLGH